MKKIYIILAIVLVVVFGGYFGWRKIKANKNAPQYVTATVGKGTITASVSGSGNMVVSQGAKVDPSTTGTVINLSVKLGDTVKKGQLLFKIKNDQLDVTVSKAYTSYVQAKQSLESAKTQVVQAQSDLDEAGLTNQKKLGTYSDAAMQVLQQKLAIAQIGVESSQGNLTAVWLDWQNQQTTADQRLVTAPISGTITSLNIQNGDTLGKTSATQSSGTTSTSTSTSTTASTSTSSASSSSASTPIVIENLDTLQASVGVNEVDIAKVALDQKVSLTFDAIEGLTLTGQVEKIDSAGTVSQGVVTYTALIALDSIDKRVRPEMSVTASITTQVKQDVITIPNSAVKNSTNGHYILVMNNGQPQEQTVEIGIADDTSTEITKGLEVGQTIVTQTINNNTQTSSSGTSAFGLGSFGGGGGPGR